MPGAPGLRRPSRPRRHRVGPRRSRADPVDRAGLAQARSHSPTASVCGRRSGAIPAAASAASTRPADRQLARQHVVEHLAALAEARLDEPPELVLARRRSSRSRPRTARATRTAESTSGAGSNAVRRDAGARPGPRRGTGRTRTGSSSAPGGAAIRSATSRWTISTSRSGRGCAPRSAVQDGLVMWYGRLATTSNGRRRRARRGPGRARRPR